MNESDDHLSSPVFGDIRQHFQNKRKKLLARLDQVKIEIHELIKIIETECAEFQRYQEAMLEEIKIARRTFFRVEAQFKTARKEISLLEKNKVVVSSDQMHCLDELERSLGEKEEVYDQAQTLQDKIERYEDRLKQQDSALKELGYEKEQIEEAIHAIDRLDPFSIDVSLHTSEASSSNQAKLATFENLMNEILGESSSPHSYPSLDSESKAYLEQWFDSNKNLQPEDSTITFTWLVNFMSSKAGILLALGFLSFGSIVSWSLGAYVNFALINITSKFVAGVGFASLGTAATCRFFNIDPMRDFPTALSLNTREHEGGRGYYSGSVA